MTSKRKQQHIYGESDVEEDVQHGGGLLFDPFKPVSFVPTTTQMDDTVKSDDMNIIDKLEDTEDQSSSADDYSGMNEDNDKQQFQQYQLPLQFGSSKSLVDQSAQWQLQSGKDEDQIQYEAAFNTQNDIGSWEKRTKGIGSKLLQKMGWKVGSGIGASEDRKGIVNPVEVELRQRGKGIGFGQSQSKSQQQQPRQSQKQQSSKTQKRQKIVPDDDDDDDDDDESMYDKSYVRKSVQSKQQKRKVHFKTDLGGGDLLKIYDYTGQDVVEHTRFHDINLGGDSVSGLEYDADVDGMRHDDLGKLSEIEKIERRLDNAELVLKQLQDQKCRVLDQIEYAQQQLSTFQLTQQNYSLLQQLLAGFRVAFNSQDQEQRLMVSQYDEIFNQIQILDLNDGDKRQTSECLVGIVLPDFKRIFQQWSLIVEQDLSHSIETELIGIVSSWMPVIRVESEEMVEHEEIQERQMTPYEHLMFTCWLPVVRRYVINHLDIKKPQLLTDLFIRWQQIVPQAIMDDLLDTIVQPMIMEELKLSQIQDVMSWIFQWLPFLGQNQLEEITEFVVGELYNSLQQDDIFMDCGFETLEPWLDVLHGDTINRLVDNVVISKLRISFAHIDFDTFDLQFQILFKWSPLLRSSAILSLMEQYFYPQLMHHCYILLKDGGSHDDDDDNLVIDKVLQQKSSIQALFAEYMLLMPEIEQMLNDVVDMVNYKLRSGSVVGFMDDRFSKPYQQQHSESIKSSSSSNRRKLINAHPTRLSMKETLRYLADKNGILFYPTGQSDSGGRVLFNFGGQIIYTDGDVIYLWKVTKDSKPDFEPISFDQLLSISSSSSSSNSST
ncbi:hypothetical protein MIR68_005529 [Amoeboaphelidium protococcarum]|nr:hypothetical protein MIR68_005529 [Amoeboaphelidium protococcarum]